MSESGMLGDGTSSPRPSVPHSPTKRLRLRSYRPAPSTEVLQVAGDLDSHAATRFAESMRTRFVQTADVVVLDLSRVTLLSTAAVVALLEARHRALMSDTALRLLTGNRTVDRLLALLEVADQFVYTDSAETAAEAPGIRLTTTSSPTPITSS